MRKIRTYTELKRIPTFLERFEYLKLDGRVGDQTFGFDRYLNQSFYRSSIWKKLRDEIIIRDLGCDLGVEGYDIFKNARVHHMNPITIDDLEHDSEFLTNPEYLITTTLATHNAIHYGDKSLLPSLPVERRPYDTCPWRKH